MIYFSDIFERAFTLFDDPDISERYFRDQAAFQADMLDFLIIGKNKFTSPTAITDKLVICDEPAGEIIEIDGEDTDTYVLISRPLEGSVKDITSSPLAFDKRPVAEIFFVLVPSSIAK